MLEAKSLVKIYRRGKTDQKKALDNICFNITERTNLGLLGANGAGKSTLIKLSAGIIMPTSGTIKCLGMDPIRDRKDYLPRIGVLFGQKGFLMTDIAAIKSINLAGAIYGLTKENLKNRLSELTSLMKVEDELLNKPVRFLSLGQRMKLELITVMLHSPEMLILDEAFIGLDVVSRHNIKSYLRMLNRKYGTVALFASHIISDVEEMCDVILVLNEGRLLFNGSLEELKHKYLMTNDVEIVMKHSDKRLVELLRRLEDCGMNNIALDGSTIKCTIRASERKKMFESLMQCVKDYEFIEDLSIREPPLEKIIRRMLEGP